MKATIKKVIEINGNQWFKVYAEGVIQATYGFRPDVPKEDIYNEERNYAAALKLAKIIESGQSEISEIVYVTKEDVSEPLQSLNNLQK